jgi:hypothetical protein
MINQGPQGQMDPGARTERDKWPVFWRGTAGPHSMAAWSEPLVVNN